MNRSDASELVIPGLTSAAGLVQHREAALVPDGVGGYLIARLIDAGDLFLGQRPADRAEVVDELRFVARTDDHGRNAWPLQ